MSDLRSEIRRTAALAIPVAATQLSTMLMGLVDILMVGRVSVEALAAASLANVWIHGTSMFVMGVLFGLDPILAQAHGARDRRRMAVALQRGVVLALLLTLPMSVLWAFTGEFLGLTGQDAELRSMAQTYTTVQIPAIGFFLIYTVLRQYLQDRGLVRPGLIVILIANAFNVLFNWVLIFGHLGFPELGLLGAGIATALTRVIAMLGLLIFILVFRLQRGAWVPWSRAALDPRGLREILGLGLPIAVQMSLEMWAFAASTLIAGKLGAAALAAHTIAMNMAALAFMLPLGVAQAATTRVGNLIGGGRHLDAQRAGWVALVLGPGVMMISATLFVLLRGWLPTLYTPDLAVALLCSTILPIAGAFQIFDGTQVVACGILRGMGRVRPAMVFNLVSYWMIGLPLGAWLALRTDWGLVGLWWGLCLGLMVVAAMLVLWIRSRGPASLARGAGA